MDAPLRRRVARSFRAVALGGVVLGVLIGAVLVSLYLRFLRYDRVAGRHLPADSVLAVRVDVEQVSLYEPVRRHLLALLGGPSRAPAEAEATLGRLEERTGLKRSDLRELVVGRGAAREDWVLVLGGIFPRGGSNALLATALAAEDPAWAPSADGDVVVHQGLGVAVARAADASLLIASSRRYLETAREPTQTYEHLGLALSGAGGIAMKKVGVRELASWPSVLSDEALSAALGGVESIEAMTALTEQTIVTVSLRDDGHGAASSAIREFLSICRGFDRSAGPGEAILRAGAERAGTTPESAGVAKVTLAWERPEVDRAFQLLADAIQDHWR
jgi:hypothetical protein